MYKTAVITNNLLIARGIAHYIRMVAPDPEIDVFSDFTAFDKVSEHDYFAAIFDLQHLANPVLYSIEKVYHKLPGVKLLLICENEAPSTIQPYFSTVIRYSEPENDVLVKIQNIYDPGNQISGKTRTNSLLSDREKEILRFVALGCTNKEISDVLSISAHTVITHRKNITAKLGIKTIAGLTIYAVLNGIISAEETGIT